MNEPADKNPLDYRSPKEQPEWTAPARTVSGKVIVIVVLLLGLVIGLGHLLTIRK